MDILEMLFSEIFVPEAVFKEFMVKASGTEDERKFREIIKIAKVKDFLAVMTLQTDLGKGESECIVLAKEINADFIVLDDKDARKIAEFLGLNVIGTLGILVMAHKKGVIQNVKSVIDRMREENFWMDNKVYERVFKEIK
ncbi:MAG: DUF3368 domain-containing protein [Theionarchaea archaeon]|nr:DUF3368 domain-containing protein [Theionarchaea archaeon]